MGTFSIWHWLVILTAVMLVGLNLPALWVLKKAGKSRWQFILAVVPIVNIVWIWVFAFSRWPGVKSGYTQS